MSPEVLVVGGGPAGSTVAAILAREGVRVVLVEQERFPRHHVGESLQPAAIDLLDEYLGLAPAIASQGFARKYGAVYVWGETREPWSILFDERLSRDLPTLSESELLAGGYEHAWQVDRSKFDELLLREAVRRGVDVRQGVRADSPLVEGGRVVGVRLASGEAVRASLVVDATGQRCLLGRAFGLTSDVPDMRATATYTYYDGAPGLPGPLGRHVQLIVAVREGWVWFIPISSERTSVGVVLRERARIDPARFRELVAEAELPLGGSREVVEPDGTQFHFVKDWSFAHKRLTGDGFILVGDAACFVDPILSGGVDFAVRGAANAALAILTSVRRPDDAVAAFDAYERRLREEYRAYLRLARYWYGNNRSVSGFFWEAHQEIPPDSVSTPLRAFVYLTSGQYAADQHYRIFEEAQEKQIFRSLGVDRGAIRAARRRGQVSARRALVHEITGTVFPSGVPSRLEAGVDLARSAEGLEGFKLNPVLCLATGRHRVAASDAGEDPNEWVQRLAGAWPASGVKEFFAGRPNAARRMVDTDGEHAVFYLDDLQEGDDREPDGRLVMSRTFSTDGERSVITRHDALTGQALPLGIELNLERLLHAGVTGGFWGIRWRHDVAVSVIWVSESRYRKNAEDTARVVDVLEGGPAWERLRTAARARGFSAYPDAIELYPDAIELTVGFVAARARGGEPSG